ncbi:hypothetical protein C2845_PM09G00350 [Panicum miliaceum]|uniref:Uncharacterized protein n=1 Tax=Panicum miliaceum TaxID=4540 RepID=A0A3L6S1N1_PANMI|nr:hypothetical protein C2845_PM09G00350 [Panicum miliaceum]
MTVFRCDFSKLGKPIGPVIRLNSWEAYMGFPMVQTIPNTCTLVACSVCVEAMHRLKYETWHGAGTFPCRAAAPRQLRRACCRDGIWTPKDGADVDAVLKKLQELGGVRTTNAPGPAPFVLPLRSWQGHHEPTLECVARLLDRGPCIGSVWVCPWWWLFDSSFSDDLVYRGCGRSRGARAASVLLYGPDAVAYHAVVCYKYRRVCVKEEDMKEGEDRGEAEAKEEMHVLVMDNNTATGPSLWIEYEEILSLHSVDVERMEPPIHLGGRQNLGGRQIMM